VDQCPHEYIHAVGVPLVRATKRQIEKTEKKTTAQRWHSKPLYPICTGKQAARRRMQRRVLQTVGDATRWRGTVQMSRTAWWMTGASEGAHTRSRGEMSDVPRWRRYLREGRGEEDERKGTRTEVLGVG